MRSFLLLALAGLGTRLVDGLLGMAYGVSSTTLLLFVGVAPALASAAVHIADVGTTAVSGFFPAPPPSVVRAWGRGVLYLSRKGGGPCAGPGLAPILAWRGASARV